MDFSIYGLRRSGNHAIIGWLIKNISNGSGLFCVKHPLIFARNVCFINDITSCYRDDINGLRIDVMFARSNFKNMLISYEDKSLGFVTEFTAGMNKIVVIRDIRNVVASRQKKTRSTPCSQEFQSLMRVDEQIVNLWVEHARAVAEEKVTGIIFERWVTSKRYRDETAKKLGMENIDITNTQLHYGGGSSFAGMTSHPPSTGDLLNRHLQVELDENIVRLLARKEVAVLRSRLGFA